MEYERALAEATQELEDWKPPAPPLTATSEEADGTVGEHGVCSDRYGDFPGHGTEEETPAEGSSAWYLALSTTAETERDKLPHHCVQWWLRGYSRDSRHLNYLFQLGTKDQVINPPTTLAPKCL